MKKIFFIIMVLGLTSIFAKGGGGGSIGGGAGTSGSFGSYHNSDKYGSPQLIKQSNSLGGNLVLNTFSRVRYKNWFTYADWSTGYATASVSQDGKQVNIDRLMIRQYVVIGDKYGSYLMPTSNRIDKVNINKLILNLKLQDDSGTVVTRNFFQIDNKTYVIQVTNEWGGEPFRFNISSGPSGMATEYSVYTEPIIDLINKI